MLFYADSGNVDTENADTENVGTENVGTENFDIENADIVNAHMSGRRQHKMDQTVTRIFGFGFFYAKIQDTKQKANV